MDFKEWYDNVEGCSIPLWKFLRIIHGYTELVKIYVVTGSIESIEDNVSDFWLTDNAFKEIPGEKMAFRWPEIERLLKYYADAPVWNVCGEFTEMPFYSHCDHKGHRLKGRHITACITARVHYKDIRDAYHREKTDIRREKRREYDRKWRAKKREQVDS